MVFFYVVLMYHPYEGLSQSPADSRVFLTEEAASTRVERLNSEHGYDGDDEDSSHYCWIKVQAG